MLATLSLESIGDSEYCRLRQYGKRIASVLGRDISKKVIGVIKPRYWVANITGIDEHYGFKREFMNGKKDYSESNSIGSRGVKVIYTLKSCNIYEVNEPQSWKRNRRYFCTVDEAGEIIELSKEEVEQCLKY